MDGKVRTSGLDITGLWIVAGFALLMGIGFSLLNLDLPILRNAFTYAKGAVGIVESGFNIVEIAKDPTWTSGRPILFSMLAAPFVAMFGVNAGMIVTSTIGSIFFLWALALCLQRLTARSHERNMIVSLAFGLTVANPLVLYQFWSGYPDSLFAGMVLLALVLVDRIATHPADDTRWHIVCLGVVIFLSIHIKLYGAILGLACPLYVLMHRRTLKSSAYLRSKIAIGVAVLLMLAATLVLAKLELNPFLHFEDGAGVTLYAEGLSSGDFGKVGEVLIFYIFSAVLLFHAALFFLASRGAWHAWKSPALVFMAVYVLGLVTFPGARGNMRYLIPVLPVLAAAMAVGASEFPRRRRFIVLCTYAVIALPLILTYNVRSVNALFGPPIASLLNRYDAGIFLDNLRLSKHLEWKDRIEFVNKEVPPGSVLYWASEYYGAATHDMGHYIGLKQGLAIRYVYSPSQIAPRPNVTFLTGLSSPDRLQEPPNWAIGEYLGRGLFRLEPFYLECIPASNQCGEPCRSGLHVRAVVPNYMVRGRVEFLEGDAVIGTDEQAPFELHIAEAEYGERELVARALNSEGILTTTGSTRCTPATFRSVNR